MSCEPQEWWKCPDCGAWVPAAYGRHVHLKTADPSLEDMVAARRLDELHIPTDDPMTAKVTIAGTYWRTGHEETKLQ